MLSAFGHLLTPYDGNFDSISVSVTNAFRRSVIS